MGTRDAHEKIAVALAGVTGKTGKIVGQAIDESGDMTIVGALSRHQAGKMLRVLWQTSETSVVIANELDQIAASIAVLVDFTEPVSAFPRVMDAVERGWDVVVGTTGFSKVQQAALQAAVQETGVGGALIPNFSLGAWVLELAAKEAARYLATGEIIEGHPTTKLDRPSGTARRLADELGATWDCPPDSIPIHSLRQPGMVAHQMVIFGADGEVITLRHDVHERQAYVKGVLTAIRAVRRVSGRLMTDMGEVWDVVRA